MIREGCAGILGGRCRWMLVLELLQLADFLEAVLQFAGNDCKAAYALGMSGFHQWSLGKHVGAM